MSETKNVTIGTPAFYRGVFDQWTKTLNGNGGGEKLATLRNRAMQTLEATGFPTRKTEDWKYTDASPMVRAGFRPAVQDGVPSLPPECVDRWLLKGVDGPRLVFVNGGFSPELSELGASQEGVQISSLSKALADGDATALQHVGEYADPETDPFSALNTAFLSDGAYIHISKGVRCDRPVTCLFLSVPGTEATLSHPRSLIVLDEGAEAQVIESHGAGGDGAYLNSAVTEVVLAPEARLDHYKLGDESDAGFHVGTTQVQQERQSHYQNFNITFGGKIVRNNIRTVLNDEEIESRLDGVYYASEDQIIDNFTSVDHAKPHCNSFELYKGIIDGKATGVFNGRIFVHQDAQKTDAKQSNSGLLLSDDATINSKPQLEIFADDVKCTHGATVGCLDEEASFYLRSRGFSRELAQDTLTYAFANEVLSRIPIEPLRAKLEEELMSRLAQGRSKRDTGDDGTA